MNKIKISSNPYENYLDFYIWNYDNNKWEIPNPATSKILPYMQNEKNGTKDFFIFKAKNILDAVKEEFYNSNTEKVQIIFEGTESEFNELKEICDKYYSDCIDLLCSEKKLKNPNEILNIIKDVFIKIKPIIAREYFTDSYIKETVKALTEATDDIIPICVIGNYSSGKSTFINSIIGSEILPCGDEPVTSKVYEISQSDYIDKATISFEYDNLPVTVEFNSSGKNELFTNDINNSLIDKIKNCFDKTKDCPLYSKLNSVLKIINNENINNISDLIKLSVPFNKKGLWNRINKKCVIIDTPGYNAVDHKEHKDVLCKSMKNLSNGLSIFVSEKKDMDAKDIKELCDELNAIKQLDKRFSLIVVNKADAANFDDYDIDHIMRQSLPHNVYASGIYYVSSVMGLGAKSNGCFSSKHNEDIYKKNINYFNGQNTESNTQLYKYDILPKQIMDSYEQYIEKNEVDQPVYINSGLCFVEKSIEDFIKEYSKYNKCHQALEFIDELIKILNKMIKESKDTKEDYRKTIEDNLRVARDRIIKDLDDSCNNANNQCQNNYDDEVINKDSDEEKIVLKNVIESKEQIRTKEKENSDVNEKQAFVAAAGKKVGTNFKNNFQKIKDDFNAKNVGSLFSSFFNDVGGIFSSSKEYENYLRELDSKVDSLLVDNIRSQFMEKISNFMNSSEKLSMDFLNNEAKELRNKNLKIISGDNSLSNENRERLSKLIVQYTQIPFDESNVREVFDETNLKNIFNKLNKSRLVDTYNEQMKIQRAEIIENIKENHIKSFKKWSSEFKQLIIDNINEFSPNLYRMNKNILEENEKINLYESDLLNLNEYRNIISSVMN